MSKEKNLGSYLKKKRSTAGFSQRDVANKLGYTSSQFVSNWERGLAAPPIPTLKKLGSMYRISEKELYEVVLKSTIQSVTEQLQKKFYGRKAH